MEDIATAMTEEATTDAQETDQDRPARRRRNHSSVTFTILPPAEGRNYAHSFQTN